MSNEKANEKATGKIDLASVKKPKNNFFTNGGSQKPCQTGTYTSTHGMNSQKNHRVKHG